jgi:hypothetical protein
MRDAAVAKVLALKAYLVVKQAAANEHGMLRAKAERAVRFLKGQDTVDTLRRRVFYNLVLAELLRDTDPIPYRAAAVEDGERLTRLGYADPASIYMRIVEATTERITSAHFGDFKSSPNWSHSSWSNSPLATSQAFHASMAPALAAVQLEESVAADYDKFLQTTTLDEIMKKHGIA